MKVREGHHDRNPTGSITRRGTDRTLLVNRIQRFCIQDGPGIRTTVFTQGCSLRCWWCHNPETVLPSSPEACAVPIDEVYETCARDARYWVHSGGGITFSGGECLLQSEALLPLLTRFGRAGYHRTIDTAGMVALRRVTAVAPHADLWLWDLKSVRGESYRRHTGGNLRIWRRNLFWVLNETETPVILRLPLINTFNTQPEDWTSICHFLGELPRPVTVEILPGHAVGAALSDGRPSPEVPPQTLEAARQALARSFQEILIRW